MRSCCIKPRKTCALFTLLYKNKKTDKEDSLKLAKLVQKYDNEELPTVSVPSDKEMERRELITAYKRARQERTRHINVLHGIFLHQGISTVVKKDLATKEKRDVTVKVLKDFKAKEATYECREIENKEKWIEELESLIATEAKTDERIEKLETIPGVGVKTALAFLAYVDVSRFTNASQVSNYLGLVPKVDISCTIVKYGGITKRGNSYLRALLVQGAWSMVRSKNGGSLRERFEYYKGHNVSKKKTIVGIARRLAGLMYTILRDDTKYEVKKFITPEQRKDTRMEKLVEATAA